jgi:ApbE superfamily uncharacterized protein (UPF0280 family)
MKSDKYQKRFYRDWINSEDLYQKRIAVKETDLQVFTDKPVDEVFLKARVSFYRRNIEGYISKDRRFLTSLKPIPVELTAPRLIKAMAGAAQKARVGPMAAVAGALAQFLGRDLLRKGYKEVIIENGGDIFLKTRKTRRIGIYAGRLQLWNKISLEIKARDTPLGVCASSGIIGHSLSFGCADTAVILSRDAALADAVATGTANLVNSPKDLEKAVTYARSVKGVIGIAVIFKNTLACWGAIEFS